MNAFWRERVLTHATRPLSIGTLYFSAGLAWFFITNQIIDHFFAIPIGLLAVRGMLFIAVTAFLIYLHMRLDNELDRGHVQEKIVRNAEDIDRAVTACPAGGSERLGREMQREQALTMLGMITAGIVHEINNPIGIIASRAELLLSDATSSALSSELRAPGSAK
ncbi:MAG TPA: hypothetical protein VJ728_05385 [Candidatus Binataceae bacterium]|nr:hypothetical protein [Candidatus Binataceae bacterium]